MKKKLLYTGVIVGMAAVALTGYTGYINSNVPTLLSANVEALAQDEGTKVGRCFIQGWSGMIEHTVFCNRRTSTEMIYPCENETYDIKGTSSMCTKKD